MLPRWVAHGVESRGSAEPLTFVIFETHALSLSQSKLRPTATRHRTTTRTNTSPTQHGTGHSSIHTHIKTR